MSKIIRLVLLVALLAVGQLPAEANEVGKAKLLILDSPYGIIETWTHFTFTRRRFGLGEFEITVPLDYTQAAALVQYNRALIVLGDDDWDNQEDRLWGVILDVQQFYDEKAGPDLGGTGVGAAFVRAIGVTYTDYFLNNRAYPRPDPVTLLPSATYYGTWASGTHLDVDEGVDDHDSDATYIGASVKNDIVLFHMDDYSGVIPVRGIRVRQVWRAETSDGVVAPAALVRVVDQNYYRTVPDANGTDTDWTGDYEDIDDDPDTIDDDATYIASDTVGHQESITFPPVNLGENAWPFFIRQYIEGRKTSAAEDAVKIKAYVIIDEVYHYSGLMTLNPAYDNVIGVWDLNPATEEPWTISAFNDAEFGVELITCDGAGEARITSIFLHVVYAYKYDLGPVDDTYAERYVDIETNPFTGIAWTDAELDALNVGVYLSEAGAARVTAVEAVVYPAAIQTTDHLDDVFKSWVYDNLGLGAGDGRVVDGFTDEADENAATSATYEIGYNILLQRFLELAKEGDVGFDIVGDWSSGATRLDANPSFEFQTCYPEGTDRTHAQSVNASVVISRGRGLVRGLHHEVDVVGAKTTVYALGARDGLAQAIQIVSGGGVVLGKEDGGFLLKEDGWPILLEGASGFFRREAVLDIPGADDTTALTAQGEKFLGDEGAEVEAVSYVHSAADIHVPLADFGPGDRITYYDAKLTVGPIMPRVEAITCEIGGDGVPHYTVHLGPIKRPALSEDAAFRATARRTTLYVNP